MALVDILYVWDCLSNVTKNHRFVSLAPGSEHLLKNVAHITWHNNELGKSLDVRDGISEKILFFTFSL